MVKCSECGQEKPDDREFYIRYIAADGLTKVEQITRADYELSYVTANRLLPVVTRAGEYRSREYKFTKFEEGHNMTWLIFREVI